MSCNSRLDHLLWAVPDLEVGMQDFAHSSGAEAALGGRHPGFGTHNALLSLGDRCYLELIAPDPTQPRLSGLGDHLVDLREPALVTWCAAAEDLEPVAAAARRLGFEPGPITPMSRQKPDGQELQWQILQVGGQPFGPLLPFFIAWGNTPHPANSAPPGCRLVSFRLRHPEADALSGILRELGLQITVEPGPEAELRATLEGTKGPFQLIGPAPTPPAAARV